MSAYNIVRFRTRPGQQEAFIEAHRRADPDLKGLRKMAMVKTGERDFCLLAEWDSFEAIVAARPQMIGMLDSFRSQLEDLGNGLGVTDPVSGEVVWQMP